MRIKNNKKTEIKQMKHIEMGNNEVSMEGLNRKLDTTGEKNTNNMKNRFKHFPEFSSKRQIHGKYESDVKEAWQIE